MEPTSFTMTVSSFFQNFLFFLLQLHAYKYIGTVAHVHVNITWYKEIILASIPHDLINCSFLVLHQDLLVDEATTMALQLLERQDKFLISFSDQNVTTKLRDTIDVHKFRDRCILSFVQVSFPHKLSPKSAIVDLYNLINSIDGVIKKDEDYFIFHSLQGQNIDTLFKSGLVASNVKNKLGIRLELDRSNTSTNSYNPSVTLYTTCFYCAQGNPSLHIISILNHNSESFHLSSSAASHILFPDLLKNFHGKEFTVSTPVLARWLIEIQETSRGYWEIRRGVMNSAFLHIMWKHNFTARFFPSANGGGTGYRFPNNTWIGTVGDVLSKKAEIGQTTGQIYNRNKVVGYSMPISYEWLTFSTGKPQPTYSWKSVYWPFTPFLWLFVIGSLVTAFFALAFLLEATKHNQQSCYSGKVAANYLLRSILEQDAKIQAKTSSTNSTRTFMTSWLIFSLLITTAYRSKLVSFLAFPSLEQLPDTFEELAESTHFQIALQYLRGAAYSLIKTSTNPTFQKIFNRMDLIENDAACFQRAIEHSHFSCISWDSIASFVYHKNLSDRHGNVPLIKARDTTSFIVVGLIYLKRSVFRIKFDAVLFRAFDMGLMIKWTELDYEFIRSERAKWEKATNRPPVVYRVNVDDALSVQNLSGTFYILVVGLIAGFLLFLTEGLLWKLTSKDGTITFAVK